MNVTQVRALLQRAVDEKGASYIYEAPVPINGCIYFEESEQGMVPSCLVGHVMSYMGMDYTDIKGEKNNRKTIEMLVNEGYVNVSSLAAEGLRAAQDAQDSGEDWGTSLAAFDSAVEDIADLYPGQ